MIKVILFSSLLVPFVILFALIGLLMLIDIVVTNAIVLLNLTLHKIEASADVRSALIHGGVVLSSGGELLAGPVRQQARPADVLAWARPANSRPAWIVAFTWS
jgi:hypothetical protein